MTTDPTLVRELRAIFKRGATPSAVIRRVAERYAGEPRLDAIVRNYFRVAFELPAARIGPELVETILAGGGVPALNTSLLERMLEMRPEWDDDPTDGGWPDAVKVTDAECDLRAIPQLAGSWDRLDDAAKEYIRRTIADANGLYNRLTTLAVLAEHLQQQVPSAVTRRAG